MNNIYDLPDIHFTETDTISIEESIIETYEAITERELAPADPVRLFLLSLASIIVQQRVVIDETGRQNLLRYAEDLKLDNLGAFHRTIRHKESKAKTTLQFYLSSPQNAVIHIPKGTRVVTETDVYFQTTDSVEVPAGEVSIKVSAECTEDGEVGNGFDIGEVNKIVDIFPYYQAVENITVTGGGADKERDNSFRQRIWEAPEGYSTAGPEGAYLYHAKEASQNIYDVAVNSPLPGEVQVIVLTDKEIEEEILKAVYEKCNDKSIRPLTDKVTVRGADVTSYVLNVTYYIAKENQTKVSVIQQEVDKAKNDYITWQKSKLGRNINPSELIRKLMVAGASRVDVISPTFQVLDIHQIAIPSTVTLTYGGIEDE